MSRRTGKTALIGKFKFLLAILNAGLFSQTSLDIAMQALKGKRTRNSSQINVCVSEMLFKFYK